MGIACLICSRYLRRLVENWVYIYLLRAWNMSVPPQSETAEKSSCTGRHARQRSCNKILHNSQAMVLELVLHRLLGQRKNLRQSVTTTIFLLRDRLFKCILNRRRYQSAEPTHYKSTVAEVRTSQWDGYLSFLGYLIYRFQATLVLVTDTLERRGQSIFFKAVVKIA